MLAAKCKWPRGFSAREEKEWLKSAAASCLQWELGLVGLKSQLSGTES